VLIRARQNLLPAVVSVHLGGDFTREFIERDTWRPLTGRLFLLGSIGWAPLIVGDSFRAPFPGPPWKFEPSQVVEKCFEQSPRLG
jgi:hypothetical protein